METLEQLTNLGEYGHADVVVTGLIDESGQLVWRYGSRNGFFSWLRRETHCQVLLVCQQIRAGLPADDNQSEKDHQNGVNMTEMHTNDQRRCLCSYRVKLFHLLPQHAGDHPDEAPVFELTSLLIQVAQQRSHRGAFTVQMGVPVHSPVMEPIAQRESRTARIKDYIIFDYLI